MQSKLDIDNLPTLTEMLYYWEEHKPDEIFLRQPKGKHWQTYTWKDAVGQIRRVANYLKSLNLERGSKIALISKNCAHWVLADQAITMSGHVAVPLYPTLTADQVQEIMVHSESKVIISGKLDDWNGMKDGIPAHVHGIALPLSEEKEYIGWDSIIKTHAPLEERVVPKRSDLIAILYTSGTTGTPKGVMLHHRNYQLAVRAVEKVISVISRPHYLFSYLPLCHVGERVAVETAAIYSGGTISFVESLDTFVQNLQDTRPTIFFGVPRIWSKFQLGVLEKLPQRKLDMLLKIPFIKNLVKNKIRKGLGLDRAEIIITTAAPCPKALLNWYENIDLPLLELYGMTENHGVCTIMPAEKTKVGSVGKPYPDSELMVEEETGEICMKADWVMTGYYKEPHLSAEVLRDGYLHTGDIGELDQEGYLFITGRLKDTFKTAKGKFVVPGPIEWGFALNNDVEQICVLGRNLPQPMALVVLSEIGLKKAPDEVRESLTHTISEVVKDLVSYEKLKKAVIVKEPWSIENGILTPTLKIKRNILEKLYEDKLADWYELPDAVVWEQIPNN